MNKGLVCIATGRYIRLLPSLIAACSRVRMVDTIYCLTDDVASLRRPLQAGRIGVQYLPWGALTWPLPTLWRYHAITLYSELFSKSVSHLVYSDVDMRPLDDCGELFGDRLVAVTHPGHWSSDFHEYPYERNAASRAYLLGRSGMRYVAGGVQGGPVQKYISAAYTIRRCIEQDYIDGIVAVWHDESHWNRYVFDHRDDVTIVGPEFCWPESWVVPDGISNPRLLALDKDHHALRGTRPSVREASRNRVRRLVRGTVIERLRRAT